MNNKSVKSKILLLVIPTVAVGLILMATIIFNYVKAEFETQILSSSTRNTLEVGEEANGLINACLKLPRLRPIPLPKP